MHVHTVYIHIYICVYVGIRNDRMFKNLHNDEFSKTKCRFGLMHILYSWLLYTRFSLLCILNHGNLFITIDVILWFQTEWNVNSWNSFSSFNQLTSITSCTCVFKERSYAKCNLIHLLVWIFLGKNAYFVLQILFSTCDGRMFIFTLHSRQNHCNFILKKHCNIFYGVFIWGTLAMIVFN